MLGNTKNRKFWDNTNKKELCLQRKKLAKTTENVMEMHTSNTDSATDQSSATTSDDGGKDSASETALSQACTETVADGSSTCRNPPPAA